MLKYIELKSGAADNGPAWIASVQLSKSGRCVYFNNRALKRVKGGGIAGNHIDLESGEEYWVSGVKKDGCDRHWAGSGTVWIEAGVVEEYLGLVGARGLDESRFEIIGDLPATDPSRFVQAENRTLYE